MRERRKDGPEGGFRRLICLDGFFGLYEVVRCDGNGRLALVERSEEDFGKESAAGWLLLNSCGGGEVRRCC